MAGGREAVLFLLLIAVAVRSTIALNILVVAAIPTRSHFTFSNSITTALLQRDHHIFELTTLQAEKHPNRTSFIMEGAILTHDYNLDDESQEFLLRSAYRVAKWTIDGCRRVFDSKAASDFLALARDSKQRPHIDVVVFDYVFQQCLGPFITEFGSPPVVAITAYGNSVEIDELVGGPMFPSFVPHDLMYYVRDKPMTWVQRLYNKILYLWADAVRVFYQFPTMDADARRFFGENASTIAEIRERVAVALVNSHPAFHGARPQLPAVVQIGGIHLDPPQKLPPGDLKDFLDAANSGFIVMNFGSMITVSNMEPWRRKEIFRAMERLRPYRFLVKWEKPWNVSVVGPLPENVFIGKWLPQRDILAHPNVRLFVTHCGGLSTNEIIHRGVPVVAVPFFMDQFINANQMEAMKIGRVLHYVDFRENSFYETVKSILDDNSYLTEVRRLSALVRDEINTPRERAVFWVEFVARHGGAPHLRSPARLLSWASRWMLDDVLIALVFVLLIGLSVRGLSKCCGRSGSTGTKRKSD